MYYNQAKLGYDADGVLVGDDCDPAGGASANAHNNQLDKKIAGTFFCEQKIPRTMLAIRFDDVDGMF